jgi:hypothetical protein
MKKKGPYTVTCIKLAVFCYIMTAQNVVYVLCINSFTFPVKLFLKHLAYIITIVDNIKVGPSEGIK